MSERHFKFNNVTLKRQEGILMAPCSRLGHQEEVAAAVGTRAEGSQGQTALCDVQADLPVACSAVPS
jgi:hypothetical protein